MKYLYTFLGDETDRPSTPEEMKAGVELWSAFDREAVDAGVLIACEPLEPRASAITIRVAGDGEQGRSDRRPVRRVQGAAGRLLPARGRRPRRGARLGREDPAPARRRDGDLADHGPLAVRLRERDRVPRQGQGHGLASRTRRKRDEVHAHALRARGRDGGRQPRGDEGGDGPLGRLQPGDGRQGRVRLGRGPAAERDRHHRARSPRTAGSAPSPTARSPSRRSSSAASTCSSARTSTRPSTGPRRSRCRPAPSRCGR